ncbi:hypothetical protein LX87_01997 [Larkinella arboricola]|uniref:Uncharacterized protein n=1 Tax=Larkinella arboricola TaxID=643671 RepID=A0A327X3Y9_LARAB|nr:hypothetical protein [Larkinella arboricola]RAK00295.1 hypothetical protein LX87_01997 [Larkinella arboricola]
MGEIVIQHYWHSVKQADEYRQMNRTGAFAWPVCRFRGKLYTICTDSPEKPTSQDDFTLVGIGTDADTVVGPELW